MCYKLSKLALSAVCCAGKCFCLALCCCCRNVVGSTLKQQVRLTYVIISVICMLFVIFVLYHLQQIFEGFKDYIKCPEPSQGSKDNGELTCLGVSSVYRMSLALLLFHFFVFFFLFFRNSCSKSVNEGLWCFKILLLLFLFIIFFFVIYIFFIQILTLF